MMGDKAKQTEKRIYKILEKHGPMLTKQLVAKSGFSSTTINRCIRRWHAATPKRAYKHRIEGKAGKGLINDTYPLIYWAAGSCPDDTFIPSTREECRERYKKNHPERLLEKDARYREKMRAVIRARARAKNHMKLNVDFLALGIKQPPRVKEKANDRTCDTGSSR